MEMLPQILPSGDPEIASALDKSLRRYKMQILTGCQVKEIGEGSEGKRKVVALTGEGEKAFEAKYVLVAVGRKPNLDGLGLQELGWVKRRKESKSTRSWRPMFPGSMP